MLGKSATNLGEGFSLSLTHTHMDMGMDMGMGMGMDMDMGMGMGMGMAMDMGMDMGMGMGMGMDMGMVPQTAAHSGASDIPPSSSEPHTPVNRRGRERAPSTSGRPMAARRAPRRHRSQSSLDQSGPSSRIGARRYRALSRSHTGESR